ncbi:MAG: DUF6600 domain-containing protein [Rhizomicrobium sp.]
MSLARLASAALLAAAVGIGAAPGSMPFAEAAPARIDHPSFQSFHDHLAPYGTWMNHSKWGAVWRPNAGRNFRPYRNGGHWEDTDEYGTTWVSDYDWGDVPFHYGRWVYDPEDGWIWVPGYVWAPAWVIWRAGAGDVGWLPMPPWINYDGYGNFPDDWNDYYGFGNYGYPEDEFDSFWSFVDADDLYAPSIDYYVIGPGYYRGILGRTQGWTNFSLYHGHLVNRSIDRNRFHAMFGHDPREGRRHDFERHLGPVTDYQSGHALQLHEHGVVHTMPAVSPTTRSHTEFHTTPPSYRSHSVNVYRGGPTETTHHTVVTHHTTVTYHTTVEHRTTMYHPTIERSTPTFHSMPSFHPSGSPSRGTPSRGAPSHGAPSGGRPR